ncbi:hypothetical protein PSCFBP2116_04730 [Pseudomonas syringae]|uniref:RNA 2'-phosphotransferase n=1 Tax=Pseudomonas syringae TaxID=317 RepID=A0A2K4WPR7_PSESX|nr:hypothetical protein CFBP3840_00829 [Pseudomonas syringae]SPD84223.1 hypothetical protein PSCFBP2116_04730 [Pseudomonas syringae]
MTAMSVGKRYGQPVLLAVDAKGMFEAGVRFFQADNGIWLVKAVSRDSLTVLRLPIPE